MSTNSPGWPDRSKEFVVNHFVPLFNKCDKLSEGHVEAANKKEESSEENENLWFFVTNKGKSSAKRSRLTANMHTDIKSSKNHQDLSRRWQKQKEAGSIGQNFESGKKEGQPCKRQNSEKKVKADKKGRNDRRKNPYVEDLKARKGKEGKIHEVPVAKKKCSENTAKPHLINKNKNEGGKNSEEKKDVSPSIDQKKQQSDILQEKEKDYENSRVIDSEMCGPSKKKTKQEVRCKTEKSESDASVTKKKRKEVDRNVRLCIRENSEKKVEADKKTSQ